MIYQDRAIEHVKDRHEQELQSLARVHTAEVRAVTESLERDLSSHKQQWQEERAVSCALGCRPNRCKVIYSRSADIWLQGLRSKLETALSQIEALSKQCTELAEAVDQRVVRSCLTTKSVCH